MDVVPIPTSSSYLPTGFFYPLVFIAATLAFVHFYMENMRIVKMGNKIPGPKTVPFFGNALIALGVHPKDVLNTVLQYLHHGRVIRAFLGTKLVIFIMDPHDVEIILSSNVHIDKSPEYRFFKPWLGEGLLISGGEKWRTHRKIIAPTFHLNVLKTFVPLFYENSIDLVKRLKSEVGKEFDVHDYLSAVTVDILINTAMGVRGKKRENTGFDYAMAVMDLCNIVHQRQYNIMLRIDQLFKFSKYASQQEKLLNTIHTLTGGVIKKKKQEYAEKGELAYPEEFRKISNNNTSNNTSKVEIEKINESKMRYARDDLDEIDENDVGEKRRLAFLDLLLELNRNGSTLTEEEVREEVDTIMFEGHDTTAAGSSFTLCVLGVHKDIQDRVYEELNEIFKGSDRPCTFQDTLEMKYLERVIMESLRMFPPVPAIARELKQDVKIATGGYVLPRGSTVIVPPYQIHRLEEYYPDPEVFNPDRFLPEHTQNRHYYAYVPFSAGPRSCVGRKYAMLKLKVLISTIIRNYRIHSNLTEKDFKLQLDIILKRTDGFKIEIEPRNKSTATA
ncbi:GSCOCT00003601001.2-RA-CDS [Cotesia congregata]|uniref:CYP4G132 n=1 Tax=Cotesia congregata TaxID=51543 RepID=A0A8J2H694_COTCN|nr:GSCOCT00003601001.2-RA-CDS [Cotesia congregata]CAG5077895.1 CYP4G132 [Cotesia congregata]